MSETGNENKKEFTASVFETLAILDDTYKDPESGATFPSEENVQAAKRWVEENEL